MQIQSLISIKVKFDNLLDTNPNRSLSGVFKSLRKEKKISNIDDYPLLSFILSNGYYRTSQYLWNRNQILRAIKISKFYLDEGKKSAYIPHEWEKFVEK